MFDTCVGRLVQVHHEPRQKGLIQTMCAKGQQGVHALSARTTSSNRRMQVHGNSNDTLLGESNRTKEISKKKIRHQKCLK